MTSVAAKLLESNETSAIVTIAALVVSTAVALLSAADQERRRRTFILLALAGLVIGAVAAWSQYRLAEKAAMEKKLADEKAAMEKKLAAKQLTDIQNATALATTTLADLASLNAVAPNSRFHLRLTENTEPLTPCRIVFGLKRFSEAIANQQIRVVERGKADKRYHILFGKNLTIAATEIYQRLARANALSNGPAAIERDGDHSDVIVNCARLIAEHGLEGRPGA